MQYFLKLKHILDKTQNNISLPNCTLLYLTPRCYQGIISNYNLFITCVTSVPFSMDGSLFSFSFSPEFLCLQKHQIMLSYFSLKYGAVNCNYT